MSGQKKVQGFKEAHGQPGPGSNLEGEFLHPRDVARILKISLSTVFRLLQTKKLPGFKLGRRWIINKQILEASLLNLAQSLQDGDES